MQVEDESKALMERLLSPATTKEAFFLLYSRLLEVRSKATELEFLSDGVLSVKSASGVQVTLYLDNIWS